MEEIGSWNSLRKFLSMSCWERNSRGHVYFLMYLFTCYLSSSMETHSNEIASRGGSYRRDLRRWISRNKFIIAKIWCWASFYFLRRFPSWLLSPLRYLYLYHRLKVLGHLLIFCTDSMLFAAFVSSLILLYKFIIFL